MAIAAPSSTGLLRGTARALLVVLGGAAAFGADDDLCRSERFREAFDRGRLTIDFPRHSPELLGMKDAAVPCLIRVVEHGGAALGISSCGPGPSDSCRVWAVGAMTRIDTSEARRFLIEALDRPWPERVLTGVLGGLGANRVQEARPGVLKLLTDPRDRIRGQAVLALGMLGNPADLDAMMRTTKALPGAALGPAVRGLELTADPRVVPFLEQLASRLPKAGLRAGIEETIARLRAGKPIRPTPLQRTDLCRSERFRLAFNDGRLAEDFNFYGEDLLALKDAAVPCLIAVVERGGGALGIESCAGTRDVGCRVWAAGALAWIGTPQARRFLVDSLDRTWPESVLTTLLGAVGSIQAREARPSVLKLLSDARPRVRANAVLVLGMLGDPDDTEAMLRVTEKLPLRVLSPALRGLEFTADPRVIPVLERLVAPLPVHGIRTEIEGTIARLRAGTPLRPDRPKPR